MLRSRYYYYLLNRSDKGNELKILLYKCNEKEMFQVESINLLVEFDLRF